jgi:hypothetical protein
LKSHNWLFRSKCFSLCDYLRVVSRQLAV